MLTLILFQLSVTTEDGLRLIPELYTVPGDKVEAEYQDPGSQERIACGKLPFMWAQSLYILGRLLEDVSMRNFYDLFVILNW